MSEACTCASRQCRRRLALPSAPCGCRARARGRSGPRRSPPRPTPCAQRRVTRAERGPPQSPRRQRRQCVRRALHRDARWPQRPRRPSDVLVRIPRANWPQRGGASGDRPIFAWRSARSASRPMRQQRHATQPREGPSSRTAAERRYGSETCCCFARTVSVGSRVNCEALTYAVHARRPRHVPPASAQIVEEHTFDEPSSMCPKRARDV